MGVTYFTTGCDNDDTGALCSTNLSDSDFTYGGSTYTVRFLSSSATHLQIGFQGVGGPAARTALSGLALDVGGHRLVVDDAQTSTHAVSWPYVPNPAWTDGQEVSVSLVVDKILVSFASPEITLCEGGLNKKLDINLSRTPVQPYAALWLTTRQVTSEFHDHNHGGVISIQHTTYHWYSYGAASRRTTTPTRTSRSSQWSSTSPGCRTGSKRETRVR